MRNILGLTGMVATEHTMDVKEQVKRDILHFFRKYKAPAMSRDFGPFEIHVRGYNKKWKDALQAAIDELTGEGLMEIQGRKLVLTEQGREKGLS